MGAELRKKVLTIPSALGAIISVLCEKINEILTPVMGALMKCCADSNVNSFLTEEQKEIVHQNKIFAKKYSFGDRGVKEGSASITS